MIQQSMKDEDKKVFLGFTVHTVHLWFFIFNFIEIKGEDTVKGEQWSSPYGNCRKEKDRL